MRFPVAVATLARGIFALGMPAALSACATLDSPLQAGPPLQIPPHQMVSEFYTNQEIRLRSHQADDSAVIAVLPKGTPVRLDGRVGSECVCWKVDTPEGTGWVYAQFLTVRFTDIGPEP